MMLTWQTAASLACGLLAVNSSLAQQHIGIFPDLPHAASSDIPFGFTAGNTGITVHQVFASDAFTSVVGLDQTLLIHRIAFAPTEFVDIFNGHVVVRLGYTDAIPAQPPAPPPAAGGLHIPDLGGGGAPNATRPMQVLYSAPTQHPIVNPHPDNFDFIFDFEPLAFLYDPAQGNLLLEIVVTEQTTGTGVSRAAGSPHASRTYRRIDGVTSISTTEAHRIEIIYSLPCYANCDGSTIEPILNVDDFTCFIHEFAAAHSLHGCVPAGDPNCYPNCDGSTTVPFLNVDDFTCFINKFAAGCP